MIATILAKRPNAEIARITGFAPSYISQVALGRRPASERFVSRLYLAGLATIQQARKVGGSKVAELVEAGTLDPETAWSLTEG